MLLHCSIYKATDRGEYDGSNGGLSSEYNRVLLVLGDKTDLSKEINGLPVVALVKRGDYFHAEPILAVPEGHNGYMFGGSFIYTSDRRFPNDYPIPLHDRTENPKEFRNYD